MALQAVTTEAVLTIPGAYATYRVQTNPSGLSTTGIIILLGEADQGPDFSAESDLSLNFFGPDEVAAVQAKYGSGRLVNGMRIASAAANDPDIQGAPQGFLLVKTNVSAKASKALARAGFTNYGTLYDQNYGEPGNLISFQLDEAPSEVAPSVTFTYNPHPTSASALSLRVNGGAVATSPSIAALSQPSAAVGSVVSGSSTGLNAIADILATGGVNRNVLAGTADADTLALVATGNSVLITYAGTLPAFQTSPVVGDTLIIPLAATYGASQLSCIAGAGNANAGVYYITAVSGLTITATKLHDAAATSITPPVTTTAQALSTEHADILCYSPVTIKNASGQTRAMLVAGNVGATITGTAAGQALTLVLSTGAWNVQPAVGDQLYLPSTAPSAWHASGANGGYYTVTASTVSTVTLTRVSNGAPASFSATAIAATTDLVLKRPAIDGVGKSLELYDGAGAANISTTMVTSTGGAVTFLSTLVSPVLNTSAAELAIKLTAARQSQGYSEEITAGGDIALTIGCVATTATMTITNLTLTTSVTGGAGATNLSINLKQFKTLGDLASFINSQTGYKASAGNNLLAQAPLYDTPADGGVSVLSLDQGTYNIASTHGNKTARVKRDARLFARALRDQSLLVQLGNPAAKATTGLPEAAALSFLTGGTRGATTDATVLAAVTACERLRANFVVALFDRDATLDAADGHTDAGSSYTIAAVNATVKTHVLRMSAVKARRNRQAFCAIRDTFTAAKAMANTMASFRVAMAFQKFKAQASDGSIATFGPWAGACFAAGMQAAGFYRSILNKGINTSGIVSVDSSFDANSDTQVEQALLNGLLVARRRESGGFAWISDQTTYALDSNFVFNSIQAIYAADLVSQTTAQRMERQLVGQSLADVSAASAAGLFAGIMADMKRLKLIASSDDAPAGFKNTTFRLQGNVLYVSSEVKIANALAFIPISFTISEIVQTASI